MNRALINVCAAVIREGGNIWICGRPENTEYESFMEFPGGKVEPGESHNTCLKREIYEELGVKITVLDCIHVLEHDYGKKHVRVYFYRAFMEDSAIEPTGREGQRVKRVRTADLMKENMLPADLPLAKLLSDYTEKNDKKSILHNKNGF